MVTLVKSHFPITSRNQKHFQSQIQDYFLTVWVYVKSIEKRLSKDKLCYHFDGFLDLEQV